MKNKVITVATTNPAKLAEVTACITRHNLDVELVSAELDLPEIQSLSLTEVAVAKAHEAYKQVQGPVIVDDTGIFFEQYPLFPGTMTKFVFEALGFDGLYKLAPIGSRAEFRCCIVYCDGLQSYQLFEGTCPGKVVPLSKNFDKNIPFCSMFAPEGYEEAYIDMIETLEEKDINHRYKALEKFVRWYKTKA